MDCISSRLTNKRHTKAISKAIGDLLIFYFFTSLKQQLTPLVSSLFTCSQTVIERLWYFQTTQKRKRREKKNHKFVIDPARLAYDARGGIQVEMILKQLNNWIFFSFLHHLPHSKDHLMCSQGHQSHSITTTEKRNERKKKLNSAHFISFGHALN